MARIDELFMRVSGLERSTRAHTTLLIEHTRALGRVEGKLNVLCERTAPLEPMPRFRSGPNAKTIGAIIGALGAAAAAWGAIAGWLG